MGGPARPSHRDRLGPAGPLADDPAQRRGLFDAACEQFAPFVGLSGPPAVEAPPQLETDEDYRLALTVHMAALAAVDAVGRAGAPAPAGPVRVAAYLLRREREHWTRLYEHHPDRAPAAARIHTPPEVMAQVVHTATLTGPLPHDPAVAALAAAGVTGVQTHQAAGEILRDHARCYPRRRRCPATRRPAEPGSNRSTPIGSARTSSP
ncbi:hypothetical protein [Cryptosporangium arvum]|uniref:hypothetical protein n=1 Tax=Cryptosporangium arvum TaxID=80871 RepID=UPI0004B47C75|nr:hypothetical protein [Cryptosporangium arvum]